MQNIRSHRELFTIGPENFHTLCDELAARDNDLQFVLDTYGYPPLWTRPNSFETLVHIILEQQVSLASALAALNKLREKLVTITPEGLAALTNEELKSCYFSRQKTSYVRYLAEAVIKKDIDLKVMEALPDEEVYSMLTKLKGIGRWTVDIYLIFALKRADVFPPGDLAVVNAIKHLKGLNGPISREEIMVKAAGWAPYRTIATMILWHYYLARRNTKGNSA